MEMQLEGEDLLLLPQRAIFWKSKKTLIVSDLHLGKAGHFRKHGIPITKKVHIADLEILHKLLVDHRPHQVILLGDLFHSTENNEWNDFILFIDQFRFVKFVLIQGNHDILEEYPDALHLTPLLELPPFSFTHIQQESSFYNLSGHIHPGIRVKGAARQSMTLSCFYFRKRYGILPAYGQFTGIKAIQPKKGDQVYGIGGGEVIDLF
ncbi:MAG: ligase-associated DNA damage response endonuclease PdeM [Ekhidna sp.]